MRNNLEIGKPMKYYRKGTRKVYLPPLRLSYAYDGNNDVMVIYRKVGRPEQDSNLRILAEMRSPSATLTAGFEPAYPYEKNAGTRIRTWVSLARDEFSKLAE